jgi:hypothetical protein
MAKQTFTTGQVLTAAQMTSLQQTAMLGGDTTAKTASYVLVAADAGTTVAMDAAGATTITVNTGLFAAGDTVFIQNRGAGVCTVTAGTATVASAGSLALPQNDAGILYFTSASAAIFYDFIQVGATSPLTTKGDLYGFSTSDARIPIGANDTVLTADSNESLGLKWAAAASGGMTLISTTTLSGASTTISFTATGYNALVFECFGITISTNTQWNWQPNATNNICTYLGDNHTGTAVGSRSANIDTFIVSSQGATWKGSDADNAGYLFIDNPASSSSFKPFEWWVTWVNSDANTKSTFVATGGIRTNTALSSMSLQPTSGTFSAGTVKLYGVK